MELVTDENGINQIFRPSPAMSVRTVRRAERIREVVLQKQGSRIEVLEIGCGTAEISFMIASDPRIHLVAADISKKFIQAALEKPAQPNLQFELADVMSADFLNRHRSKFDFIVGNGILHHLVKDMDGAFTKLHPLLKPGGKLVFWEPNLQNPLAYFMFGTRLGRKMFRLDPDEMAFTRSWIRVRLERTGFQVCQLVCRDFLLPNTPTWLIRPVIWLGALLERTPLSLLAQSIFLVAAKSESGTRL